MKLILDEASIILVFVAIVYGLFFYLKSTKPKLLERYSISVEGLTIMLRTSRYNDFIRRVGSRYKRFWKLVGNIGILVGVYLAFVGLQFLHQNIIGFFYKPEIASPVTPIIPGVTIGLHVLPYIMLAIAIVLIPHELMHGFLASAEGIKIKSTGFFIFTFFLGGFVEPDEEALRSSSLLSQIRIFSAGSFVNFVTYIFVIMLIPALIFPVGVGIEDTIPGYPAYSKLERGDVIVAINGTKIITIRDLSNFMDTTEPGNKILLTVIRDGTEINVDLILVPSPYNKSRGFMGVKLFQKFNNDALYEALWWLSVITASLAVINMLPAIPLDGGRIVESILLRLLGKKLGKRLTVILSGYIILILVLNIILSIRVWGLRPFP